MMTDLYVVPEISSPLHRLGGTRLKTIRPEAVLVEGQDTPPPPAGSTYLSGRQ